MTQPKQETTFFPYLLQLHRALLCALGMAALLGGAVMRAQDGSERADATLVMHVSTTLVQIPVLVLTPTYDRIPGTIAANEFSIRFDGGPPSRPKYVRLEGDDPINLAIVLDTRAPQEGILSKIDQAIAGLAPQYLHAQDHVSIYAMDCAGLHTMENVQAEPGQLKHAADVALSGWMARREGEKMPACKQGTNLWDVLGYVTDALSQQPGRRVILAVTNGEDKHSRRSVEDLTSMVQTDSVTILGLDPSHEVSGGSLLREAGENNLSKLCESSGGLMLNLSQSSVPERLQQFTSMLRGRYILEFPRQSHAAGRIDIAVTIDRRKAFIRPAGNGVPVADRGAVAELHVPDAIAPVAPQVESHPDAAALVAEQQPVAVPAPQQTAAVPEPQQPMSEPVAEEQQESSPASAPVFRVSTRLTVEDVTVTNAKRAPVLGLLQPDFLLKEDGKAQEIRHFEEYGAGRPLGQAAQLQSPQDGGSNAQASAAGVINVLLLDDVSTGLSQRLAMAPQNLAYAKEQSIQYLKTMPAGTQVMILQLGSTLRMVQGLTSDRTVLMAAMHSISYEPVVGTYVTPPGSSGAACAAANAQSELTVNALEQVAAFLSGIKGRKNVIWFTPGTPWLTDYPTYSVVGCLRDHTAQLHRDYGLLNEAEVALYPVDPRGLFNDSAFAAGSAMSLGQGMTGQTTGSMMMNQGQRATQEAAAFGGNTGAEHNALQEMADATGGVPYFNRNDVETAVREAVTTGGHYYSLSYVPPLSKYDDKYHTIEVKVSRPGVNLQYRKGYTAVDLRK